MRDLAADRPGKFFTQITVGAGHAHQHAQKLDTGTLSSLTPICGSAFFPNEGEPKSL